MLIYLASPYSHPDRAVRTQRFWNICKVAARLVKQGRHVYSPIAHSYPIALCGELPDDWAYWSELDELMLKASQELWVIMLYGWEDSVGIKAEVAIAERLGLPIRHLNPETLHQTAAQCVGA